MALSIKITRLDADTQAFNSQQNAAQAQRNGYFKSIVPVFNPQKDFVCAEDECIRPETTIENLSSLNPSFEELGKNGVDDLQLKHFPQLSRNSTYTYGRKLSCNVRCCIDYSSV